MRKAVRVGLAGAGLWLAVPVLAPVLAEDQPGPARNPLPAVRAADWAGAQAAVAWLADPVAEKLVLYLRLRAPGAATEAEIADFMRRNPDWPAQDALRHRREEALAADPDDAAVLAQCSPVPALAAAILRCADANADAGHAPQANDLARRAWVDAIGSAPAEADFLRRWGGVITDADQQARFRRLAWNDPNGAARQITRLGPGDHGAAEARLAAKRDDPQTEALIAALPPDRQADPGLFLDRVRALRRADHAAAALALWQRDGGQAQDAAPEHRAAFWSERNNLIRKLLHDGDAAGGFALASTPGRIPEEAGAEAGFLAGFIALRRLHDPARAAPFFEALARSRAVISQSRAHYWLGRTLAAQGEDATVEYGRAAAWPTTFYGQLAILALGRSQAELIAAVRASADPTWTEDAALAFTGQEVPRAAAWLLAWGDGERARAFLLRADELAPTTAERALSATFALRAGLPDGAVSVARRLGRDGIPLPRTGWPAPFNPTPPPDPSFTLGIMRQESSFDIAAVSPSGARGLMQLMPPTAAAVGRSLGIAVVPGVLTTDPDQNIRLGTTYLQDMLNRFAHCLPLAAAAYNAGPHRVEDWLRDNGDPRSGPVDMVDWIELIPGGETRNYVQRVVENATVYRATARDATPILPDVPWTR